MAGTRGRSGTMMRARRRVRGSICSKTEIEIGSEGSGSRGEILDLILKHTVDFIRFGRSSLHVRHMNAFESVQVDEVR